MGTKTLTMSPSDLFDYRNMLVKTQKYLPLGRMRTIAIGPNEAWQNKRPAYDPYIDGWGDQPQRNARGRMMDLSGQWLPIAQAKDSDLILCTSTLVRRDGYVGLPDLADPQWHAEDWTPEEVTGAVERDPSKDRVKLIPQHLRDRHDSELQGTNFLVFRPVLRITYQPEELKPGDQHGFKPAEWKIEFRPDFSGEHCAFLVDEKTGVCHFFGGIPIFGGDTRG